jgi:hypothetical protein
VADRYAGVDWASDRHDVLVQDAGGEEVPATPFGHDKRRLRALCGTLVRLNVVLVAIERLDGLLIERRLDAGLRVRHPADGRRRRHPQGDAKRPARGA